MTDFDSFDGQLENEDIENVWHRSALSLSKSGFIVVAIILFGSLPLFIWQPSWDLPFLTLFILIAVIYTGMSYYNWINTVFILTNIRLLAVEQDKILSRKTSEILLKNIQNISHVKRGLLQMIFDFGDIEIQTAGAKAAIIIKNIEHPYDAQQKILKK